MSSKKIKLPSGIEVEFHMPDLGKVKEFGDFDINYIKEDNPLGDWARFWLEMNKNQKEDSYTEIPGLGTFKNLSITNGPFEEKDDVTEMTITFKCDEWEKLKDSEE